MDTDHQELRKGEVFITNSGTLGFYFRKNEVYKWMRWKTKRRGTVAYNSEGEVIGDGIYPIFIKLSEYEAVYGKVIINDTK